MATIANYVIKDFDNYTVSASFTEIKSVFIDIVFKNKTYRCTSIIPYSLVMVLLKKLAAIIEVADGNITIMAATEPITKLTFISLYKQGNIKKSTVSSNIVINPALAAIGGGGAGTGITRANSVQPNTNDMLNAAFGRNRNKMIKPVDAPRS